MCLSLASLTNELQILPRWLSNVPSEPRTTNMRKQAPFLLVFSRFYLFSSWLCRVWSAEFSLQIPSLAQTVSAVSTTVVTNGDAPTTLIQSKFICPICEVFFLIIYVLVMFKLSWKVQFPALKSALLTTRLSSNVEIHVSRMHWK